MLPPHTYLPRLYANYSDRNNCVQCDADEGCFKWYHWECEGITLFDLGDIKEYICKGCRGKNLGKMTYKGYNPAAELPDDAVQNEDETEEEDDEDVDEYLPESDDQDDSDGSDSDSESRNAKHGSKDSEMKAIRHLIDTCLKDLVEVQRKRTGIDQVFGVLRRILAESESSDDLFQSFDLVKSKQPGSI
jgi:hypothetical protein